MRSSSDSVPGSVLGDALQDASCGANAAPQSGLQPECRAVLHPAFQASFQLSQPQSSQSQPAGSKRIIVLGSTGSIGTQTLDVARQHPDKVQVVGLAAGRRTAELLAQAHEFGVRCIAIGDGGAAHDAAQQIAAGGAHQFDYLGTGPDGVVNLIHAVDADVVVNSLVGAAGLRASYETLKAGKTLALANKESLVVGGDLIMQLAHALDAQRGWQAGSLMPIDSEHGAIFQCLIGEDAREVSRLWVTASGGPFRGRTRADLAQVTPREALAHPTWNMGAKISIDSSTLMNKGLEVIEAHHLFGMDYDKISVVVQPQSAIHSMVEFSDGSVKAHLGTTDMRIPIQYALSFPQRWDAPVKPLDFTQLGHLDFAAPDPETFPCLALARSAGQTGGTLPCVMNAANEVAVAAFLAEACGYLQIADCVAAAMDAHVPEPVESLEQLAAVDAWARDFARTYLGAKE